MPSAFLRRTVLTAALGLAMSLVGGVASAAAAPVTTLTCTTGFAKVAHCTADTTPAGTFKRNHWQVDGGNSQFSGVNPKSFDVDVAEVGAGDHVVQAWSFDQSDVQSTIVSKVVHLEDTPPAAARSVIASPTCLTTWSRIKDADAGIDTNGFVPEYFNTTNAAWAPMTKTGSAWNATTEQYSATIPTGCTAGASVKVRLAVTDKATNTATFEKTVTIPAAGGAPTTAIDCPTEWQASATVECEVAGTAPNGFALNTSSVDAGRITTSAENPSLVEVTDFDGEAVHVVRATTTDFDDVIGAATTATVKIDYLAPTADPPSMTAGCVATWTSVQDGGSGIDASQFAARYSTDGGGTDLPMDATGGSLGYSQADKTFKAMVPAADGACNPGAQLSLSLHAGDNVGNAETAGYGDNGSQAWTSFVIPAAGAPTATVSCPQAEWVKVASDCTVTGTGGASGYTTAIVDGLRPGVLSSAAQHVVHVTGDGVHRVDAAATNGASVTGAAASARIGIDTTSPTGFAPSILPGCIITWAVQDQTSGIDPNGFAGRYTVDGINWKALPQGFFAPSNGRYQAAMAADCTVGLPLKVMLDVTDKAGNLGTLGGTGGTSLTIPTLTSPVTNVDCGLAGWSPSNVACNISNDIGGTFKAGIDVFPTATNAGTISVTTSGTHQVNANSTNGAVTGGVAFDLARVDKTPPVAIAPTIATDCTITWTGVDDTLSGLSLGDSFIQWRPGTTGAFQTLSGDLRSSYSRGGRFVQAKLPAPACVAGAQVSLQMTLTDKVNNQLILNGASSVLTIPSVQTAETQVTCLPGWHNDAQDCEVKGTPKTVGDSVSVSVDGGAFIDHANPWNEHISTEGHHTITATTTNAGGTSAIATGTVDIDLTKPVATAPTAIGLGCAVTFTGVKDEATGSQLDTDALVGEFSTDSGASWTLVLRPAITYVAAAQTATFTIPACQQGPVQVHLTVRDLATNTATIAGAVQIPNKPVTTVQCDTPPASGWFNDLSQGPKHCQVSATALGGFAKHTITVGGVTSDDQASTVSVPVSAQGTTQVSATTTDQNGLVSLAKADSVKIDTVGPSAAAPVLTGCDLTWNGVDDVTSGVKSVSATYSIAGGAFNTFETHTHVAGSTTYKETLSGADCTPGATIKVLFIVTDNANNQTAVGAGGFQGTNLTIPGAPTTTIACLPGWHKDAQDCVVTGSPHVIPDKVSVKVDDAGAFADHPNPWTEHVTTEGHHTITATTTNVNGVSAEATATVDIDLTAPQGTVPAMAIGAGCSVTFTGIQDPLSGVDDGQFGAAYTTNGTTWTAVTTVDYNDTANTATFTLLPADCKQSQIHVRLKVQDAVGNAQTIGGPGGSVVNIPAGPNDPTIEVRCGTVPASGWFPAAVTCSVDTSVAGGVGTLTTDVDGGSAVSQIDLSRLVKVEGDGNHTVHGTVKDPVGRTASASGSLRIDSTTPTAVGPGPVMPAACAIGWTSVQDALSGLDPAKFAGQYSADQGATWKPLEAPAFDEAAKTFVARFAAADCVAGTFRVRLKAVDKAGNAAYVGSDSNGSMVTLAPVTQPVAPECSDGKDNDADLKVDAADPACHTDGNVANAASYGLDRKESPDPVVNANVLCAGNVLRLTDVYPAKGKVQILGVAPRGNAGKTVSIYFAGTKKAVAKAKVAADLTFKTTAKMPAKKLRTSSKSRYQAKLGKLSSAKLKLARRLYLTNVAQATSGKIQVSGAVVLPISSKHRVSLRLSTSCKGKVGAVVTTAKPKKNGTFSFSIKVPKKFAKAPVTYVRVDTMVPKTAKTKVVSFTASLIRGLNLRVAR